MRRVRVLLVDDNPQFLAVAGQLLGGEPELEISGSALSGKDAIEQISRARPDVVLLDLFMPEMNGLETARVIKALPDAPRIVIVTMDDDPAFRSAAAASGTDGFLAKSALPIQLVPLIRRWFN